MIINCHNCGIQSEKPNKEINRRIRLGAKYFFCSTSCSAIYREKEKNDKSKIYSECPVCSSIFINTTYIKKAKTYCSRSCASKGSVTDHRRQKAREIGKENSRMLSIKDTSMAMKSREAWKYIKICEYLNSKELPHEFEYVINGHNYIYDLAIFDLKIIIEFDGQDHQSSHIQRRIDVEKEKVAHENGWTLLRIEVDSNIVIGDEVLHEMLR